MPFIHEMSFVPEVKINFCFVHVFIVSVIYCNIPVVYSCYNEGALLLS